MPGRLTLGATPIGNLADISSRLAGTLADADVVFAEDTRRTSILLGHLGLRVPMRSFFAGNERERLEELRALLEDDRHVVLVSDAGMPTVSDPGASAVRVAIEMGAPVSAIPGPSAVTMALAVSGFPADRFVFLGFLERRGAQRAADMASIAAEERTVVWFAAPSRIHKDLADLVDADAGDRPVAVARELTKLHEEVWRGTVTEAAAEFADEARRRGEFTVVMAGVEPIAGSIDDAVTEALDRIAQGSTASDAVRAVAAELGVSRREVYDRVMRSER